MSNALKNITYLGFFFGFTRECKVGHGVVYIKIIIYLENFGSFQRFQNNVKDRCTQFLNQ